MEWLLHRNKAWTKEIWLFEIVEALGSAASAKTWRGLGGLRKKSMIWKFLSMTTSECHQIFERVL